MNKHWLQFILTSLVLIVLQVWVFSPIALFRIATPYVYPFLLLLLPIRLSPAICTSLAFAIGTVIDIFSLTPGLHASAFTFVGFLRYYLVKPMIDKNMPDHVVPLYSAFKGGSVLLLAELMAIHHALLYLLDAGFYFDPKFLLIRLGAGWLCSMTLALTALLLFSIRTQPRIGHG